MRACASTSSRSTFRSALPHEERLRRDGCDAPRHRRFDPRSRTRSDSLDAESAAHADDVSIRAPARGATVDHRFGARIRCMFRSALPHEERPTSAISQRASTSSFDPRSRTRSDAISSRRCRCSRRRFDPRSRTRSDPYVDRMASRSQHVSIRAPARGATRLAHDASAALQRFDPRSRTRSDRRHDARQRRLLSFDPRSRTRSDRRALDG